MWSAWSSLKTYHWRPSSDLEVTDSIAAYCLDKAVLWFGITMENLLGERVEVGSGKDKRWEAKYELLDLLDEGFRVPRETPKPKKAVPGGLAAMLSLAGVAGSGVKHYQYVKPS